jgi:hypothetical protein
MVVGQKLIAQFFAVSWAQGEWAITVAYTAS